MAANAPRSKREQILFFAKGANSAGVFFDHAVAHGHFFIKLHAHFEDFAEVFLILVEEFVEISVADQNHFHIDLNGLRLQRRHGKRIKRFERLNLQPVVVQRALQRAPHARFGKRFNRVHDQKAAIGAQQGARPQVHKIASPAAARIVGALNVPEEVGVSGRSFKNNGGCVLVIVRENDIHAINAERVALRHRALLHGFWRFLSMLLFPFALFERAEIVQKMVAYFFQILRDAVAGILFLQLLDDAVNEHGSRFLFQIAEFAGQFARERERLAVDDRELLAKLFVFPLDFLRHSRFQLALVHHFRNVFNRYHLAFEHREDFRKRHRTHLHVAQGELFAGNAASEIVHQILFAHGKALYDAPFLPLERFAFEHLRYAPPQKIDSRLHVFLEIVRGTPGESEQPGAIGDFEIVDVTAIQRRLGDRMKVFNHLRNSAATAGAGQPADKNVIARRRKLHAHLERAQRPFLPDETFALLRLRGSFERNPRKLAAPAKFFGAKLGQFRFLVFRLDNHRARTLTQSVATGR